MVPLTHATNGSVPIRHRSTHPASGPTILIERRTLEPAAVVVALVEVIPEAKRRQIGNALEAYEAIRRDQRQRRSDAYTDPR